jgi:predicted dehydrogenase/ribosomal protein S18 acetylase RimI-like enzyme
MPQPLRLTIIGAAGRGGSFKSALDALAPLHNVTLAGVCDITPDRAEQARATMGAEKAYTRLDHMLDDARPDALLVATPMHLHLAHCLEGLQRNLHVLCEVPAAVSIDECRQLALAARRASQHGGSFSLAENYTVTRPNLLLRELARQNLFGIPYFADAEYLHEIRAYETLTPWRRHWQLGIPGNTYCTHSLGPLLQWMPGQRVTHVLSASSGSRHTDAAGKPFENQNNLTLCKLSNSGLIKLRLDLLSDRPHAMTNYQLQGTDGAYESARAHGEPDRIWLRSLHGDSPAWHPLASLEDHFLPEQTKTLLAAAQRTGHGGGDYFILHDFLQTARGLQSPTIDIDAALDMTLPGLCSQLSEAKHNTWVEVPDPRAWTLETPTPPNPLPPAQLHMTFAPNSPIPDPAQLLAPGYRLRQYTPADEAAYIALMDSAGFTGWSPQQVQETHRRTLEAGHFVIEQIATGELVATALANHAPTPLHPHGGELGWVAASPHHAGRKLGLTVCAAVLKLFRARAYQRIYLSTDDHRLPAIATYLKLGFQPLLYREDMPQRWQAILSQLKQN